MAHPMTLPTVAILSLVGTGLGVHLGKEAISEINPLYFSAPGGTRSYAALTPHRGQTGPEPRLRPASEAVGLGSGCIGCRNLADEFAAPPQPDETLYAQRRWEVPAAIDPQSAVQQLPQLAAARDEERMLIETYSRYPVTLDEQRRHELAIEAAVAREFRPEPVEVVEPAEAVEPVGL